MEEVRIECRENEITVKAPAPILPTVMEEFSFLTRDVVNIASLGETEYKFQVKDETIEKVRNGEEVGEEIRERLERVIYKKPYDKEINKITNYVASFGREKVSEVSVVKTIPKDGYTNDIVIYIVPRAGWTDTDTQKVKESFPYCTVELVDETPEVSEQLPQWEQSWWKF